MRLTKLEMKEVGKLCIDSVIAKSVVNATGAELKQKCEISEDGGDELKAMRSARDKCTLAYCDDEDTCDGGGA